MYGRLDHFWFVVRRRLADVLGLIGRNWLSCLGWSLFAMAISEPAHAQSEGQAWMNCAASVASKQTQICHTSSSGNVKWEARCTTTPTNGTAYPNRVYFEFWCSEGPNAGWVFPPSAFGYSTDCSAEPPDGGGEDGYNWPGGASHTECFGGCKWVPAPNNFFSGSVGFSIGGQPGPSATNSIATMIVPTGEGCAPGSNQPPTPEELPPPPAVCAQIADTGTVCIQPGQQCNGYVGSINGASVCVPAIAPTPCVGPFCKEADPPGDADNDESNLDTPDADIHYWYEDNGTVVNDTDFFIPSAPETGGCNPCPPAGDPQDPREDQPTDPNQDTDGDGMPDSVDIDIDGDGKDNGDDDDVDGDGYMNDEDSDIDGDGVPNENDIDADGDFMAGGPAGSDPDDNGNGTPDSHDNGAGQDPDGECNPETGQGCEQGSASGGARCDVPPSCTGDPVACMVAHQAWQTRCAVSGLEDRIFDTEGADQTTGTEGVTPGDVVQDMGEGGPISFDRSGFLGGSYGGECPNLSFEIMGHNVVVDADGKFCAALNFIPLLTLLVSAWIATNIVMGASR